MLESRAGGHSRAVPICSRVVLVEQFNDCPENQSGESAQDGARPVLHRAGWAVFLGAGLLAAVLVLFALVRPARADVAMQYFEARANAYGVLLSWGTSSERNVQSFDVFCKLAGEPESAYHFIGSKLPQGGLDKEADYSYLVPAHTLKPGQTYCFKVREITTEPGIPGETREACGFGISITPTPTPTQTVIVLDVTPTPIVQSVSPLMTPTFTPVGYVDPAAANVFATATAMVAQATLVGPVAATPTPDPFAQQGMPTQDPNAAAGPDPFSNQPAPTSTPFVDPAAATATMDAFNTSLASPTPSETPTPVAGVPSAVDGSMGDPAAAAAATMADGAVAPGADSPLVVDPAAPGGAVVAAVVEPTPSPTSLYIPVTAEPPAAAIGLPALPTPWPTATPAPALAFAGWLAPTAQNLTVMLLCFIFVSASGLGALGLITSVIYMRSQSRRRELEDLRRRSRTRL